MDCREMLSDDEEKTDDAWFRFMLCRNLEVPGDKNRLAKINAIAAMLRVRDTALNLLWVIYYNNFLLFMD
jgi:hypothetical protein